MASAIDVKNYFGVESAAAFAAEWKKLSAEEKAWFQENVPAAEAKQAA